MKADPIRSAHRAALEQRTGAYHEFLVTYKKDTRVVYGFLEGKTDPSFYRSAIDAALPEGWTARLIPAGTKKKVYETHARFDWRRFRKDRICFFIDRDLSDLIPEKHKADRNIFVTSRYSIENHFDSRMVCDRILTELYCLTKATEDELDQILDLFEAQREKFFIEMVPVMARILSWRRVTAPAQLENIKLQKLFSFSAGTLQNVPLPAGKTIDDVIHQQCKLAHDPAHDFAAAEKTFKVKRNYRNFTRGKFVLWFLVGFCQSVHEASPTLFKHIKAKPKPSIQPSCGNGVALIGPRCATPRVLRKFIKATFVTYIEGYEAKVANN